MSLEGPLVNIIEVPEVSFEGNDWVLPTDIRIISDTDDALMEKLKSAGWDTDSNEVSGMVEFAFHEALMNAIIHGNLGMVKNDNDESFSQLVLNMQKEHPTDKKVYVSMKIDKEKVWISIRDEGKGFVPKEVADPTSATGLSETKGRGIAWMKNYFDSVKYNETGNEVVMIKERKAEEGV